MVRGAGDVNGRLRESQPDTAGSLSSQLYKNPADFNQQWRESQRRVANDQSEKHLGNLALDEQSRAAGIETKAVSGVARAAGADSIASPGRLEAGAAQSDGAGVPAVKVNDRGLVSRTVDANGSIREFSYGADGQLREYRGPDGSWTYSDGKQWVGSDGRSREGAVQVSRDGDLTIEHEGRTTLWRLNGTKESTEHDGSVIVQGKSGHIKRTIDAHGKERKFEYGPTGKINRVTEEDGSTWSTNDGSTWTTPAGRTWKGTIALEKDGAYRYVDENLKETIKRPDGTATMKEANGRITDTLPDGTTKVVHKAVDREELTRLAERLHGDDGLYGGIGLSQENNRRDMIWKGEVFDRLDDLSEVEREALKGIYHQKYGHTINADYAFLEGKDKEKFDNLFQKIDDPVEAKADRLRAAIDKSREDYSWYSYSHTDRHNNSNDELRNALKSLNSEEIRDLDNYHKRVYGVSLHDAIKTRTPRATREMCEVYLKGCDQRTSQDEARLSELTANERRKVDGVPNCTMRATDVKAVFERNFEELDADKNGFVSSREIDKAMVNPDFKGEDAQLVVLLKQEQRELAKLHDEAAWDRFRGVSKKDIETLARIAEKSDRSGDETELINGVDKVLRKSGRRLTEGSRNLWGVNSNPIDSIKPEAIDQGQVGDCYFLASVAAMASTPEGKESLKNMIEDHGDGTYTVTFPDDPKRHITVDEPTQSELAHSAAPTSNGIWVAVLEKAYGQYYGRETDTLTRVRSDAIGNGGLSQETLKLLSGRGVETDDLYSSSKEETHRRLAKAMDFDRPVVADISYEKGEKDAGNKTRSAGLPAPHSFAITAYDPDTRTVTIRNPWAANAKGEPMDSEGKVRDGNNDGTFTMSLDEFHENFDEVHYAESRPRIGYR